jgi:hypothetical protein
LYQEKSGNPGELIGELYQYAGHKWSLQHPCSKKVELTLLPVADITEEAFTFPPCDVTGGSTAGKKE